MRMLLRLLGAFLLSATAIHAATLTEIVPSSAPRGGRVVFIGTGLEDPAVQVTFAAAGTARVEALVLSRSSDVIEAAVPPAAVSGEVRLQSNGNAIAARPFTVSPSAPFVTVRTHAGGQAGMKAPSGAAVTLPGGDLVVADSKNNRIVRVSVNGAITVVAGGSKQGAQDGPAASARFKDPAGVAWDPVCNCIYVADAGNHSIRRIASGQVTTLAGSGKSGDRDGTGAAAELKDPYAIALSADGTLFVADRGNHKIRRVTPQGVVTTLAGRGTQGLVDGPAAQAAFKSPEGVVAAGSSVYVADTQNAVIREIANGVVRTIAGTGQSGALDGALHLAQFRSPSGIAADDAGRLIVSDSKEHRIRLVDLVEKTVTTIAGDGKSGLTDGAPLTARFKEPSAITTAGAVYITDSKNDAIRMLVPGLALRDLYPRRGTADAAHTVRVFGSGFVPGLTVVRLGGLQLQSVWAASTEMIVTIPPGPMGRLDLSVSTPAGTATLREGWEYAASLVALQVTPDTLDLEKGEESSLTVSGTTANGSTIPVSGVAWTSTNELVATVDATGVVRAIGAGSATIRATLERPGASPLMASAAVTVRADQTIPPDPSDVAPTLQASDLFSGISFLYTGPDPIQRDVAPGTIAPVRASVIRGRVLSGGQPVSGIRIHVVDRPELGHTLSRADGMFDMVVNGGGPLVVRYQGTGYLTVDRQADVPWQDFVVVPDAVLIPVGDQVTTVAVNAPDMQVARGSVETDGDGSRQATMLFAANTSASMTMADGTTQPLASMNVRATEYTVGPNGPQSMPAPLPPQSAYTYCVELSVDEAIAAGATSVVFSKPVAYYVDNFLGFPAGFRIPVGSYDRVRKAWVSSANATVIAIVSIEGGAARVDTDGDGAADDLGLDLAERQQLASLYGTGKTLWRAMLDHFTPVDINAPLVLPQNAQAPSTQATWYPGRSACGSSEPGSIIHCESQGLGEVLPVTGTGFGLFYQSDRMPGRRASRVVDLDLTPETVPSGVLRVELEIVIAGRTIRRTYSPQAKLRDRFEWDGRDAYGRLVPGAAPVAIHTRYVYPGVFGEAASGRGTFGLPSGRRSAVPTRTELHTSHTLRGRLGNVDADSQKMGGWSLSAHHTYDVIARRLHRGDGSVKDDGQPPDGDLSKNVVITVAGRAGARDNTWSGAGGRALGTALGQVTGMAVAPDGTIYLSSFSTNDPNNNCFIHKITPDGRLLRVAGLPGIGQLTDWDIKQPALSARLAMPQGLSVGPDGSLYVAEYRQDGVRRITPDGMISPFAGSRTFGSTDPHHDVPALQSEMYIVNQVLAAPDGSVYISDAATIRRVMPDGRSYVIAGTHRRFGTTGDGGPATEALFDLQSGSMALGLDGSLLFEDAYRIRRIANDGILSTIAGTGDEETLGDGGPASLASTRTGVHWFANSLAVGPDGSVYLQDNAYRGMNTIRRVDPSGIITTVYGNGTLNAPEGTTAGASSSGGGRNDVANGVSCFTLGPDGSLYYFENETSLLRKIAPPLPSRPNDTTSEIKVVDSGITHVFTAAGRHLRTIHTLSGATLLAFEYDADGMLTATVDIDGNRTRIERNAGGYAERIVAPGGQVTTLSGSPWLEAITTAPGETTRFVYRADGLMTSVTDPRGRTTTFEWNDLGNLILDQDPEGGSKSLTRTETANGQSVTVTTALGKQTRYSTESLPVGDQLRTTTDAAGLQTTILSRRTGPTTITTPDGMVFTTEQAPDPVWGALLPFTKQLKMQWPGGQSMTADIERQSSASSTTERITINQKTSTVTTTASEEIITSPMGRTVRIALDPAGRPLRIEEPTLLAVQIGYTKGLLSSVTQGTRSQTFTYNDRRELTAITDSLSRSVEFEYDDAGRVTKQILPDRREILFNYDASGNLLWIKPPGRDFHQFVWSGVNLATDYMPPALPGAGTTQYVFNADREMTRMVRGDGLPVDFTYDRGRLSTTVFGAGSRNYLYDAAGRLASIAGADAGVGYGWDGSRPASVTWNGAVSGSISWTYDDFARLATETASGKAVDFTYDDDGLLSQAGELSINRWPTGRVDYTDLDGTYDTMELDEYGELDRFWHEMPTVDGGYRLLLSADYTRDAAGRITSVDETVLDSAQTIGYQYDSSGRLEEVSQPGGTVRYAYDANGNRLSRTVTTPGSTVTETATYDGHDRLLTYDGTEYSYNGNGDLASTTTGGQTTRYQYDALGNLLKVTKPDGMVIDYLIDGQNRRVGRKVDGVLTHTWQYADQLRIIAEQDHVRGLTKRFVYATRTNVPDYMEAAGIRYRIFADHLGSPRFVVNTTTREIARAAAYDEYGNVLADTDTGLIPFGFAGGLYDVATGLTRFGARDYDPRTGRWTVKEPLGFRGGDPNLYVYVGNDPVNWVDPSGLIKIRDMDCADLASELNRLTGEVAQRAAEEENWQRDLLSGRKARPNIENIIKYWKHRREFEAKQRRIKKLLDEFDRRPCKPDLTPWNREWASESFPDDEYLWTLWGQTLKELILEGPPKPEGPVLIPGVGPVPVPVMVR